MAKTLSLILLSMVILMKRFFLNFIQLFVSQTDLFNQI